MRYPLLLLALTASSLGAQSVQYRSRAGVEYRSQPDTGAVARAEAALRRDPRDIDKLIALGVAQSGVRRYREAIATFTRGMRTAPDNALLYRWRGHRYISIRDFDAALRDLTAGNRLDPANYDIWYHLGVVKFIRGDFPGAAAAFTEAQRRAPNDNEMAGSTDWLWMALSRAGRRAEAGVALERAGDSLRITSATAYAQRLRLYRGQIGPEQVLTPADTADIAVATLNYGVGNWYLVQGDTARARERFERAVASGGWPAFGFIIAEVELRRLR